MNSSDRFRTLLRQLTLFGFFSLAIPTPTLSTASTFTAQGTSRFGSVLISTFSASPGNDEFSLRLSSGLFLNSGPISFPDGTKQFAAWTPISTITFINGQTFSNHEFSDCLPGSTVTITMSANSYVGISFAGDVYVTTTSGNLFDAPVSLAVLIDGNSLGDYSGAGVVEQRVDAANASGKHHNLSFSFSPTTTVAEGTHSACLQAKVVGTDGLGQINSSAPAEFSIFQIR